MNFSNFTPRCLRRVLRPLLSAKRRLAFEIWFHLRYENSEAELVHLDRLARGREVAIDAGANRGFFSMRMSSIFKKVYAFEINAEVSEDLKNCGLSNVEVHDLGLSNRTGEAKLYIPVHMRGFRLNGWASLERGNCAVAAQLIEKKVRVRPLDDFEINNCSLLKIDVEGHELQLLEGAINTIRRGQPLILIEIREQNMPAVCRLLESLGYRQATMDQLAGVPGSAGNFIFIPS